MMQSGNYKNMLIEQKPEYNFTGKTILVVEDNQCDADNIKEILSGTGINIIHTVFGFRAIHLASIQSPDLILMDIQLPDMDGFTAAVLIKENQPKLKIIAQIAFATYDDKLKAIDSGCNDYISKPLKRAMLLSMINKHLAKQ